MVGGLYKMRWQTFINVLNDRMNGKATPMPDYYTMENNWTHSRTSYPTITAGDPVKTAQELFAKYFASK
jgi:hypothetical protein